MLNVIDEFTHECLAIRIDRRLKAVDVFDLADRLRHERTVPLRFVCCHRRRSSH
jgi:hypothetical protein